MIFLNQMAKVFETSLNVLEGDIVLLDNRPATMIELTVGLAEYFTFYNGERPRQSLGQKTPDVVYKTAMGSGAMIVDKYQQRLNRGSADQLSRRAFSRKGFT